MTLTNAQVAALFDQSDYLGVADQTDLKAAFAELVAREKVLHTRFADISAASSAFAVAPRAITIQKVYIVLNGAITAADSIVTGKIGATSITGLSITVANAASGAGSKFNGTPTAANVAAAGDTIEIASDGASSTTATADVFIVYTDN